jgi:hypothetical protein
MQEPCDTFLDDVPRLRRLEILICVPTALPWANLRARVRRWIHIAM